VLSYTVTDSAGTSRVLIQAQQAHTQQQQKVTEYEFSLFRPPEVNAVE
jgi:hypothetical protein